MSLNIIRSVPGSNVFSNILSVPPFYSWSLNYLIIYKAQHRDTTRALTTTQKSASTCNRRTRHTTGDLRWGKQKKNTPAARHKTHALLVNIDRVQYERSIGKKKLSFKNVSKWRVFKIAELPLLMRSLTSARCLVPAAQRTWLWDVKTVQDL